MGKKLFVCAYTIEAVVLADDLAHARRIAAGSGYDILGDDTHAPDPELWSSWELRTSFPPGWDPDCIPYGEEKDRSIAEILAEGTDILDPESPP